MCHARYGLTFNEIKHIERLYIMDMFTLGSVPSNIHDRRNLEFPRSSIHTHSYTQLYTYIYVRICLYVRMVDTHAHVYAQTRKSCDKDLWLCLVFRRDANFYCFCHNHCHQLKQRQQLLCGPL